MIILTSEVVNVADKSIGLFGDLVKQFGSQYPAIALFALIFIAILALILWGGKSMFKMLLAFFTAKDVKEGENHLAEVRRQFEAMFKKLDVIEDKISEIRGALFMKAKEEEKSDGDIDV